MPAARITIDTAADEFGAVNDNCSLREAIESANHSIDFGGCTHTGVHGESNIDIIDLPTLASGAAFNLIRFTGHDDANDATDLDIDSSLRIFGVSASNAVIRGDAGTGNSNREHLFQVPSGTVTLSNLTLRDGRGLGDASHVESLVRGNRVTSRGNDGRSGGVSVRSGLIHGSTIENNEVAGEGGGMSVFGSARIVNSTVLADRAKGVGGGILASTSIAGSIAQLSGVTIAGNISNFGDDTDPLDDGGGIRLSSDFPLRFRLRNSVIADNQAQGFAQGDDCSGTLVSDGYNHVRIMLDCSLLDSTGHLRNADAELAAPSCAGGPLPGAMLATQERLTVRAPSSTSRAIDAGNPAGCIDSTLALPTSISSAPCDRSTVPIPAGVRAATSARWSSRLDCSAMASNPRCHDLA